ncbi:uncharacterized protein LOC126395121 [Epinephelus moara]|uniref:uncharacterized protein LOC126395121 n=1 Tax=Epinephelus moara TaxID=300413 RepID=UPI00214F5C5F|nr:uncharacterized protein LOC126395121 [Epinephelus moara]
MREAGLRVQPNLSRFTVGAIIRTFRMENRTERQPHSGGKRRVFTPEQETLIVNMVRENNAITLRQIKQKILADNAAFNTIQNVSLSTLDRVLKRNSLAMKQVYRVPFERNTDHVKELRRDFVLRIQELDTANELYEYIFIDEAGFNLAKRRRRGRNIIGQRAIVGVPGQRGGNITMCAAINHHGVLHRHVHLGAYNTDMLLAFLDDLHEQLVPPDHTDDPQRINYVVIWDNVSFHRALLVRQWFQAHPHFTVLFLPPYSPFLNPIEEFFSAWRWKVYERNPQTQVPLVQAMEEACGDVSLESIQGFMRHSRRFFQRCLDRENIACDVDEALWPDRNRRHDDA